MSIFGRICRAAVVASIAGFSLLFGTLAQADPVEDAKIEYYREHDAAKTLSIIRPLAEEGNAAAEAFLARFYGNGDGVKRDSAVEKAWIRRAAEHGDPASQMQVGDDYARQASPAHGEARAQALFWFRKAADQAYRPAYLSLALLYDPTLQPRQTNTADAEEAVKWYRKAAEGDDDHGIVHQQLLHLYDLGYGGPDAAFPTGPSFDCARASSRIEKLICADAALSIADRSLSRSYARLIAASGPTRPGIVAAQSLWLDQLDRLCPDHGSAPTSPTDCLRDNYKSRQMVLSAMADGAATGADGEKEVADWLVGAAFPFILSHPGPAATIFRTADSPQAKLGLALVLKFGVPDPAQHEDEIKRLFAEIDSARSAKPIPEFEPPIRYDGTAQSVVPYIGAAAGRVTLPCGLFARNPALFPAIDIIYAGAFDEPTVACGPDEFVVPPSVGVFEQQIAPYTSFSCFPSGFMRRLGGGAVGKALLELQIAPRLVLESPNYSPLDDIPLRLWSYENAGNRLAYLRLRALFLTARQDVSRYYQRQFGLDPGSASTAANRALWNTIVWGQWETPPPLVPAIMGEAGAPSLANLLGQVRGFSGWPEPLLSLAMANPDSVAPLVQAGADVNATNPFGKTPLMTAAQYDQLDAIKRLLKAGADVNAASLQPEDIPDNLPSGQLNCNPYNITHGSRTALMYAAANASLSVIRTLLKADADPKLADSKGSTALDYLMGKGPVPANPVLNDADRATAKQLLGGGG